MAVAEKVKEIIVNQLGVDASEVTDDASFIEDLGADSIDLSDIIMQLEDEFGIEIPESDTEKIKTVGDAINYIKEKTGSE